jgi:hypothetical protein
MPSIPAAPNRVRITADVVGVERSADFPRRWTLRLALRSVQPLVGGVFVHSGQEVDAFTIGDAPGTAMKYTRASAATVGVERSSPSRTVMRNSCNGGSRVHWPSHGLWCLRFGLRAA